MRDSYWAPTKNQVLLALVSEPPAQTGWQAAGALLSCALIFAVDVLSPGIVVGLLYSLVLVGVSRLGHTLWLVIICALGTLLHVVAGFLELAEDELHEILGNRGLAIIVLWVIGGWIAYNVTALRARKPISRTSVTIC